ncbi:hypothetical protein [Sulfurirhabdus autotrophica]|nr:hypothetical protein [Sulfurirhabdus autotrophica]
MIDKIISYNEILQYAGKVDTNKQVKVLLSKYQAFLFRKKTKMMQHVTRKSLIGNMFDIIVFIATTLAIFTTCPKVAFLSDFHGADKGWPERIVFQDHNKKVLVIFNPPDLRT